MKITIIGNGYVGLVTGACLADFGNQVFFLDVDKDKVALLNRGEVPIYEPGLKDLIARNRAAGRIIFSTDVDAAVAHGDVQVIAVGTPAGADGAADLQYVFAAAENIGRYMSDFKAIITKSTVPVGTADKVSAIVTGVLRERRFADPESMFSIVSNPEFLKEGAAVNDFLRPDRIIIGSKQDAPGARACAMVKALYEPMMRNHDRLLHMDVKSAEFSKYAANAMLATRISFMNELANLAEEVGADIEQVRRGIGSDPRIGHSFLYAGTGYGGSCFPKDVQSLLKTAESRGHPLRLLQAVHDVNADQRGVLVRKIVRRFGADLTGRTFAIWGLAFKPNTNDVREAPSLSVISSLLARGASVKAYDPIAIREAATELKHSVPAEHFERVTFYDDQLAVLDKCDALVIVTEWKAFWRPDFSAMRSSLKTPLIFDGRNIYEPSLMQENGFQYHAIGRG
ncbi:MAG TPA: UDP-glucose/GDP-mannose dehydrogenase family protein [Noviherbaspirillum sp.]|nr:UDP-glucose/GDP-mannose dehydrogenase family protein [Noviherbaspirillum sp.]